MKKAEVTQLMLLFQTAWPHSPMFKGATVEEIEAKLNRTTTLWAASLPDVDFRTAQAATLQLVRKCKFPPTVAELLEEARSIKQQETEDMLQMFGRPQLKAMMAEARGEDRRAAYLEEAEKHPRFSRVIRELGGPDAFWPAGGHPDVDGAERVYTDLLARNPVRAITEG